MTTRVESNADGIRVFGEMSVYTASQLKQPLLDALAEAPSNVEVDLQEVSEFDTAGVQLLLLIQREALVSGRSFRMRAESAIVREVLTLFGAFGLLKGAPNPEVRP